MGTKNTLTWFTQNRPYATRRTCMRAWSSIFAVKHELIPSSTAAYQKRLSCEMQNKKTDINFSIFYVIFKILNLGLSFS